MPVIASDKLGRVQVRAADNPDVRWQGAFAVYGGNGSTQSSTIVYEIQPGIGSAGTPTPPRRRNTSSPAAASCSLEDGSTTRSARQRVRAADRREAQILPMSARKPCAPSPSSPPRCSPRLRQCDEPATVHILGTPNRTATRIRLVKIWSRRSMCRRSISEPGLATWKTRFDNLACLVYFLRGPLTATSAEVEACELRDASSSRRSRPAALRSAFRV